MISPEKQSARVAVSISFFLHGLCFSSWAARIPAIQQKLGLSETTLGTTLFAIPVGLILSMPLTAWLVTRIGSRGLLGLALLIYGAILSTLGSVDYLTYLLLALFVFGMASNMVNVAVNTQAVSVEALYGKSIMASFHGLWSLAGFAGASIGTFMIAEHIAPATHFRLIFGVVILAVFSIFHFLVRDEKRTRKPGPVFVLPDRSLMQLGLIAFCSMTCEGAMFDWSGVYFKKAIFAQGAWVAAGYTAFMSTMAGTRFVADRFMTRYGLRRVLQFSGFLASTGLLVAVIFPSIPFAMAGFFCVGAGVSAVIPLVFGVAGKTTRMPASTAIAAVSTIGFIGFLIGPPLIGWIAGLSNLRVSFAVIAVAALCIPFLASRLPTGDL
jgi:MFS family permease